MVILGPRVGYTMHYSYTKNQLKQILKTNIIPKSMCLLSDNVQKCATHQVHKPF